MTDKPVLRVLDTPHDHGDILVHHAGDPWAESELLGLPGCPAIKFRRDSLLGQVSPMRLLGIELSALLEAVAQNARLRLLASSKGTHRP
jgi:hypothetical protein